TVVPLGEADRVDEIARMLAGDTIWSFSPEKVLAVRNDWAENEPALTGRLLRAVWRASRWLGTGGVSTTAAEMLSRPEYLNLSSEIIDRALSGHLVISSDGESREVPGFLEFWDGAATFPWKSQAAWIAEQMAGRLGLDRAQARSAAAQVFRSDLFRQHLREAGAVLPGASEKLEGGIARGTRAGAEVGRLDLAENRFFDGRVFDPLGTT
ncbi:MAG: ABC transporter substrate-binding protein, partial [Pseudomonadota bacterium]